MAQIVFSPDELAGLCQLIPHPLKCIIDPATIVYPAVIKFLLVQEWSKQERDKHDTVYLIPFDSNDILDFYEQVADRFQKAGIDGYEYAESSEGYEGPDPEDSTATRAVDREASDSNVRAAQADDNTAGSKASEAT